MARSLARSARNIERIAGLDLILRPAVPRQARVQIHVVDTKLSRRIKSMPLHPLADLTQDDALAKAGDRDVRDVLATVSIEPDLVDDPRAAAMQETHGLGLGHPHPQASRLAARWEHADATQVQVERGRLEILERGHQLAHLAAVDLVEEVQGQVQLLVRLPARTLDAAAEHLQIEVDVVGKIEAKEQSGHRARSGFRSPGDSRYSMTMRTAVVVLISTGLLTLSACGKSTSPDSNAPGKPSENAASDDSDDSDDSDGGDEALVGSSNLDTQLPEELVAELRLQGDNADGRLVTLAPGFIATAACSDCGAPSYLWFVAVRCSDERHCEVLTESCSGKIGREADSFTLEFQSVDGAPAEASEICAGYTGTFIVP